MLRYRILVTVVIAVALAGCATRLAYSNLDWLLLRNVDGLVKLEGAQRDQARQSIEDLLVWHCATQLPAYSQWLESLRAQTRQGTLTAVDLEAHVVQIEEFWQAVVNEGWPEVADWLASLSKVQAAELFESFEERNQEIIEEYLEPPAHEVRRQRARNMERSLARFFGRLDAGQRHRVEEWSRAVEPLAPLWLENRLAWQSALARALEIRDDPALFNAAIETMLTDLRYGWSDEYQRVWAHNQRQLLELIADIHTMASERQRARFEQRLVSLGRDFERLSCPEEPASSSVPDDQNEWNFQ